MDKKKSIINLNKLTSIIKPMTRLQLNKFVSNLNKQLKITNASKMKRTELESELLMKADIIIDMIDNDKDLKLFDTKTKPRAYKITQEEQNQMSKEIMEISQKAIEEKDMGAKSKLTKEAVKKSMKLAKSTVSDMPTKKKASSPESKETKEIKEKIKKLEDTTPQYVKNVINKSKQFEKIVESGTSSQKRRIVKSLFKSTNEEDKANKYFEKIDELKKELKYIENPNKNKEEEPYKVLYKKKKSFLLD